MTSLTGILKNRWLPFLFAIPLYFSFCHYEGLVCDAILYVTQYVYSIDPLRFWGDPAFEYGNQDSLGFFSPIFGIFLEWFGVTTGAFVYTILMQFSWIIAVVGVVKSLLRRINQSIWVLPVTIIVLFFFAYGIEFSHIHFFRYVELYACSRSLSVILGLGAITLLLNQKKFLSLLIIVVGTVVHPITAGWCLPFWLFYFFPKSRIPVLVMALIFPVSFLLHSGPFDIFPEDWLSSPLGLKPRYEDVARYIVLLVFFVSLKKITRNEQIKNLSVSSSVLLVISLYWDVWGGCVEHIFLYQVQTWRAVWLPSIIAVPLGTCFVKDSLRKVAKGGAISTSDLGVIILLLSFLAPRNIIVVSAAAALLVMMGTKKIPLKAWVMMLLLSLLASFLVQQYITWFLQGLPSFLDVTYTDLYPVRDSFLFYQFCFSVPFAVYFFKKKSYVATILLVLSIFFAHFMLLPVLALFFHFFPKENRLKFFGGAMIIVVLMLFDGLIDIDARRATLIEGMHRFFPWICAALTMSLLSIDISRRISYCGIAIWLVICTLVAVLCYNHYSENWFKNESQIDKYLHESIFPQVRERGKILFCVSGEFELEPRLQFLTGSYLSRSTLVGGVFNKEHYRMGLERSNLIYYRESNPNTVDFFVLTDVLKKLADVDTLIDRTYFLCDIDEITHLVSDRAPLPFVKEDSTMVNESQKVYLYGCPSVE